MRARRPASAGSARRLRPHNSWAPIAPAVGEEQAEQVIEPIFAAWSRPAA